MQGDLAGQDDRAGRGRQQQAAVEQPAQVRRGVGGDLAVGRAPGQAFQYVEGGGRGPGEQLRHPGPVGEQGGERGDGGDGVVGGGQTGGGEDLLDAAGGHPGGGLLRGGAQPGRGRVLGGGREQFPGRAHQPQPVVAAPHQGLFAQGGEGAGQGGGDGRVGRLAGVPGHESEQFVVGGRVRGDGQGLGRLEREPVQPLQGPYDRGAGAGPGGELGEVRGDGGDEIGAAAQEGGQ